MSEILIASNIYSQELYFKVASKLLAIASFMERFLVETLLVIRNGLIELISVIDFSFSFKYIYITRFRCIEVLSVYLTITGAKNIFRYIEALY